ncbi:MAG: disulfide bond formation protein B [Chloroflexi bacterium]|nr:disulfide bond formation protein B [Chloroflexota bacterium]
MTLTTERISLIIALIAAWVATLGSLYFSEVLKFIPCTLCWYQRILMYPLALIILVAALRRDRGVPAYVLPFSIFGIFVSSYHYLLQKTDLFQKGAVCTSNIPCTATWINWFGFITIPFLALTAFIIITLAMFVFITESQYAEALEEDAEE